MNVAAINESKQVGCLRRARDRAQAQAGAALNEGRYHEAVWRKRQVRAHSAQIRLHLGQI